MASPLDIPTRGEMEHLVRWREPGTVSIYLSTDPAGQQIDAERLELSNLVADAVGQLRDAELAKADIAAIEQSLTDVVDDALFWRYQANTLAVFANSQGVRTFRLPNQLASMVEVSDRFHVKPLLRTFSFPQTAFVLALAQGSVRVVEVTAELPPNDLDVPDLPSDLASAGGGPEDKEGAGPSIQGGFGDRGVPESQVQTQRLRQYARQIDRALRRVIGGFEVPLVLAGTEPLTSVYRGINSYGHLADAVIVGNPEATPDAELAQAVRPILDDLYRAELAELHERFGTRRAQGLAVADLAEVARAATYGAVDTVIVDIDATVSGTVADDTGAISLDPADDAVNYGVIDEIARRVLVASGRVVAVRGDEVPGGGPVAALLRHPLV